MTRRIDHTRAKRSAVDPRCAPPAELEPFGRRLHELDQGGEPAQHPVLVTAVRRTRGFDDQLVPVVALHLEPVSVAPRAVRSRGSCCGRVSSEMIDRPVRIRNRSKNRAAARSSSGSR